MSPVLVHRPRSDQHLERIPDSRRHDERTFADSIAGVFGHQPAVYHTPEKKESRPVQLARHFYKSLYEEPELTYGNAHGAPADTKEFISRAILEPGDPARNNITYLLGEIGAGKTAYLNWLISTQLRQHVEAGHLWFVRLDVEDLAKGRWLPNSEIIFHIGSAITLLQPRYGEMFKDCLGEVVKLQNALAQAQLIRDRESVPTNHSGPTVATAIAELAHAMQSRTNRRLCLLLDNLDFLCHLHDRGLYTSAGSHKSHVLLRFHTLVSMFGRKRELGHMGANVVIAARADSYTLLANAGLITSLATPPLNAKHVYVVHSRGLGVALRARLELLKMAAGMEEEQAKRDHYALIPKAIEEDLEIGTPKLVEQLLGISNDGLRQVMLFFGQYGWVGTESEAPATRVIHSYPVGLLTFMLGGFARFSEKAARFPNAYSLEAVHAAAGALARPYSYWLKRLIMHYVASGGVVDIQDLLETFAPGGEGYGSPSVLAALGNLTDSQTCFCLGATFEVNHEEAEARVVPLTVQLNKRGRQCLEKVFDRFFYLQLVVEDPGLPIPRIVDPDFAYPLLGAAPLDYKYVIMQPREYFQRATEMVKAKARQVLLFLEVLESAMLHEENMYPAVFRELQSRNVALPRIPDVREAILAELTALNPYVGNVLNLDALRTAAAARRPVIDANLDTHYKGKADVRDVPTSA